jgi:transposase
MASLLKVCAVLAGEIAMLETAIAGLLEHHQGYQAIRALPGIGPVLGAVIVAEIGDITRFRRPAGLCSWAGLTPRHRESDTKVSRGHITKQGSRILRWALIEAIQHVPAGHPLRQRKDDIIARRGAQARNIAKSPRPASCSPGSSTPCATARSDPWPPPRGRPREQARTRAARDRRFYWPPPPGARPPV